MFDVRDTRWDQFAYQFAHELCHVLADSEHRDREQEGAARSNQWFEEALCEVVSLFTLRRMAERWASAPPHAHWRGYAPAFREYLERLMAEPHRSLSGAGSLAKWYEGEHAALSRNPYLREKNELVSAVLFPLFERDPESLGSVAYLNADGAISTGSLGVYLEGWYLCCPDKYRNTVRQVMAIFRLSPDSSAEDI